MPQPNALRTDVRVSKTFIPRIEEDSRRVDYTSRRRDLVYSEHTAYRAGVTGLDRVVSAYTPCNDVLERHVISHQQEDGESFDHRQVNAKMHRVAGKLARKYGSLLTRAPIISCFDASTVMRSDGKRIGMQPELVAAKHVPIIFDAANVLVKATLGNPDRSINDFRMYIDTNTNDMPPTSLYVFGVGEGDPTAAEVGSWRPHRDAYQAGIEAFEELYKSGDDIAIAYEAANIAVNDSVACLYR